MTNVTGQFYSFLQRFIVILLFIFSTGCSFFASIHRSLLASTDSSFHVVPSSADLSEGQTFKVSGQSGTPPYTFEKVDGGGSVDTDGNVTVPSGGSIITIRGTDSKGQTAVAVFNAIEKPEILPSPKTLAVNNKFIFSAARGKGPYSFSVVSGSGTITTDGDFIAPTTPQTVVIEVTDSLGGKKQGSVIVVEALAINPASAIVGANTSKVFSSTGGVPPIHWEIESGTGTFDSTTLTYSAPSLEGTAVIKATDSLGNEARSYVQINGELLINPPLLELVTNSTFNFSASGGVPPYSYTLFSGTGEVSSAGAYKAPASIGEAEIQVTDAQGNASKAKVLVNLTLSFIFPNVTLLVNESKDLSLNVIGGTPPLTYSVSADAGTINPTTGIFVAGTNVGTFTATVTDSKGHQAQASVTIVPPMSISPQNPSLMVGDTLAFSSEGGIPPYSYSVTVGGGAFSASLFTAPTTAQSVTVKSSDSQGHFVTTTVNVKEPLQIEPQTVSLVMNSTQLFTATGGLPPYSYKVSSGIGDVNEVSGLYTSPAVSGTASIEVQDSDGNKALARIEVIEAVKIVPDKMAVAKNASLSVLATGGKPPYQFEVVSEADLGSIDAQSGLFSAKDLTGDVVIRATDSVGQFADAVIEVYDTVLISPLSAEVVVSDSLQFTASGGQPPYSYAVLSGDTSGGIDASSGLFTATTTPGEVKIKVTDSANQTSEANIKVLPPLTIDPASITLVVGSTQQFKANGGVSPYQFLLSAGTGQISESGLYTTPSSGGTATITATDSKGHTATAAITIHDALNLNPLSADLNYSATKIFTPVGGLAPFTFSLVSGPGTFDVASGTFTAGTVAGKATLRVTDSVGTVAQSFANIVEPVEISPATLNLDLSASFTFKGVKGSAPYIFRILSGGGAITNKGFFTAPGSAGPTVIEVEDSLGQKATANINVFEALKIVPTTTSVLPNSTQTLSATGGFGAYTFTLLSGNGTLLNSPPRYVASATEDVAKLQVTDGMGNTAIGTINTVAPVQISPINVSLAYNELQAFAVTGGSSPYTFSIISGGGSITSKGIFTAPAVSGVVTVRVTDSLMQTADATVSINATLEISPSTLSLKYGGTQTFTAIGGQGPYSYVVKVPGAGTIGATTGAYVAPNLTTTETIEVTDALGKTATATVNIYGPVQISPAMKNIIPGATFTFSASGGKTPYSFSVSAGGGSITSAGVLTAGATNGSYTVRVTDALGQTSDAVLNIDPKLELLPATSTLLAGATKVLSISGGRSPYSYSFTGSGAFDSSTLTYTAPTTTGSATITVTDSLGNTSSATLTTVAGPPTTLTFISNPQTVVVSTCSSVATVKLQDSYGNDTAAVSDITVTLSAANLTFYSNSNCSTAITDQTIPTSATGMSFYFKGNQSGLQIITLSAAGLGISTQTESLVAGTATVLAFTSSSQTVLAAQCSAAVQFVTKDNYGNLTSVTSAKTVSISAAGMTFYTTNDCSGSSVTSVSLGNGDSGKTFYFKGTTAKVYSLGITSSGFTGDTQSETVTPGNPDHLAFTIQPTSLIATNKDLDTQPAVTIYDVYNNIVNDQTWAVSLAASSTSDCSAAASGTLSVATNPQSTSNGVVNFSGVKYDSDGTIYLKATLGSANACSSAIVVNSSLGSLLAGGASIVPSDGLAETTILVIPKSSGSNMGPGKTVEVSFSSTDVTVTGAGACRTPSATCVKAVDHGQGGYTVTAKSAVPGVYTFTAVIGGSPDISIQGNISVIFNTASFTVISANTTITAASHAGKNLYFTGGTATFDSSTVGQSFGDIFIRGGTVTHTTSTTSIEYKLDINVNSLTVMSGGINVDTLGYFAGKSFSATGPSTVLGALNNTGGSHGGEGGGGSTAFAPGATFDDYKNPKYSGGGAASTGKGGGVIRVTSTNICTINSGAALSAIGQSSFGGAGGSIYLNCSGFAGTAGAGAINANGGTGTSNYGGGGGGRIAMISSGDSASWLGSFKYPLGATSLTNFKSAVKSNGGTSSSYYSGGAGTIYTANSSSVYGDMIVSNGDITSGQYSGTSYFVSFAGSVNGTVSSTNIPLTASNGSMGANYVDLYKNLRLRNLNSNNGTPNIWTDDLMTSLNGNTSTDLTSTNTAGFVNGNSVRSIDVFDHIDFSNGALIKSNGDIVAVNGTLDTPNASPINLFNTILNFNGSAGIWPSIDSLTFSTGTFTNSVSTLSAKDIFVSGATLIIPTLNISNNLKVTAGTLTSQNVNVTNQFWMTGGTVNHPTATTTTAYTLQINTGSLLLDGGTINVLGLGYPNGYSYSSTGPSNTLKPVGTYAGGSHAGQGGQGSTTYTPGATYDDYRNPSYPGGGGESCQFGGGVVRITSTNLCTINAGAKIIADGGGNACGTGAGGSIYLKCSGFAGTITANSITANGGSSTGSVGGAGGGRIAMISTGDSSSWTGSFTYPLGASNLSSFKSIVKSIGGTGNNGGGAGTIFVAHSGSAYGDLIIDNNGLNNTANTGLTFLVSVAGTVNNTVTGTNIPISVSNGAIGASYLDIFKSSRIRNTSNNNSTPNNWIDDPIVSLTGNTSTALTSLSTVGFANGDTVRSIDILDHIDFSGSAMVKSHGDIVVLNGTLSNPNSTVDLTNTTLSFTGTADFWPSVESFTYTVGNFIVSSLTGKNIFVSGATLNIPAINATNNLKVTAGTLTSQNINVTNQFWMTGGTVNHPATTTTTVYSLQINTGSLLLDGGSISVLGLGYTNGYSYSSTGPSTAIAVSGLYAGGSHAGQGGQGSGTYTPGGTFDDYKNPALPGGGGYSCQAGGGVVRIVSANLCTINAGAKIIADGSGNSCGTGAGGSVYLKCSGFDGTASSNSITANGGSSAGAGGGGGGGRIAMISTGDNNSWTGSFTYPLGTSNLSSFKSIVKSMGGTGTNGGAAGTIYVAHSGSSYGDLIIDNNGLTNTANTGVTSFVSIAGTINAAVTGTNIPISASYGSINSNYLDIYKPNRVRNVSNNNGTPNNWIDDPIATLSGNTATALTSSSTAGFANGDSVRTIDIFDHIDFAGNSMIRSNGDIVVLNGTLSNPNSTIDIVNSTLSFAGAADIWPSLESLTFSSGTFIGTNLTGKNILISGATLTIPTVTATNNFKITSGTLTSQNINITNQFWMTGGTINHPTTTTSTVYILQINTGSLLLDGGSINVTGLGYTNGYSYSPTGPSTALSSASNTGGSHGGEGGGGNSSFNPGPTFDDYKNPMYPGGGASSISSGGGVVRITSTGLCVVNSGATINANGAGTYGGAGGSIYLNCSGFNGTAAGSAIIANGGTGTGAIGGGGGGRIAMISTGDETAWSGSFTYPSDATNLSNFKSVVKAVGGANTTYHSGGAGTIYLKNSNLTYGDLIIDNNSTTITANAGKTKLIASTANSSLVTSSTATALTIGATAQFSNYIDYYKNSLVHIFPVNTGAGADPRDASHIGAWLTSNSSTALISSTANFPNAAGYYYKFVYPLDHLDVGGKSQLNMNGADLVLTTTTGSCDLHSVAANSLDIPAGSTVINGNSISSGYCLKTGQSGTQTFTNNFFQ